MFIEAAPGDQLLKLIRQTEEQFMIAEDQRIKIVSKSGTKLVHLLERKDPFAKNCDPKDCPPCASLEPEQNILSKCMTNNVCYEVKCKTCEQLGKYRTYTGETCRNLHVRSKEHLKGLETNDSKNWMFKHINMNMELRKKVLNSQEEF